MRLATASAVVAGLALAVALALILSPSAHATTTSIAISHPKENDVRMRVGENIVFQIALYNYGENQVELKMIIENSGGMMSENLDGIITVQPMSLVLSPGTEDAPTIGHVACTLAPTRAGVFAGDVGAIPVELGTGIRLGNTLSMPVKITVTVKSPQHHGLGFKVGSTLFIAVAMMLAIPMMVFTRGKWVPGVANLFTRIKHIHIPRPSVHRPSLPKITLPKISLPKIKLNRGNRTPKADKPKLKHVEAPQPQPPQPTVSSPSAGSGPSIGVQPRGGWHIDRDFIVLAGILTALALGFLFMVGWL